MRLTATGGSVDIGTILSAGRPDASGAAVLAGNITSHGAVNLAGSTTVTGQLLSGSGITITGASINLGTAFACADVAALRDGNVIPGQKGRSHTVCYLGQRGCRSPVFRREYGGDWT